MKRKSLFYSIILIFSSLSVNAQDIWIGIENGTRYAIVKSVDVGEYPQKSDVVSMRLKKYGHEGLLMFSTDMIDAEKGVEIKLTNDVYPGDILDVFLKMKPGEKAKALVPVWVADKDSSLLGVDSSFYQYEIELIAFKSETQIAQEQAALMKVLRIDQQKLFDSIATTVYPKHHIYYKKDGLYILTPQKVKYKRKSKIQSKEEISVHYLLKLLPSMRELDNSYSRNQPFKLRVDHGQVIKGWDIGLMQLKKGSSAVLLIPSWLGYGFTGSGRDIGPNTPLLFEIEILNE